MTSSHPPLTYYSAPSAVINKADHSLIPHIQHATKVSKAQSMLIKSNYRSEETMHACIIQGQIPIKILWAFMSNISYFTKWECQTVNKVNHPTCALLVHSCTNRVAFLNPYRTKSLMFFEHFWVSHIGTIFYSIYLSFDQYMLCSSSDCQCPIWMILPLVL